MKDLLAGLAEEAKDKGAAKAAPASSSSPEADMLTAIKANDAKALKLALTRAIEACYAAEDDEDDDGEE